MSEEEKSTSDTSQIDLKPLAKKRFPGRLYRIYISREAYDVVWKHAREAPFDHEVGGMLIGEVCRDEDGPFLDISAAIPAEHTKNEDTQVTFTPESWIEVNKVKDEKYPDLTIVGWYHTHPRFGIFMSDRDRFIQSTSFSQPWTTAFVVDPVKKLEGFFTWQGGQPKLAQEYWVGGERRDRGSSQRAEKPRKEEKEAKTASQEPASSVSWATSVFTVILAVGALCGLLYYAYTLGMSHAQAEGEFYQAIEMQTMILSAQKQVLAGEEEAIKDQQNQLQLTMQNLHALEAEVKKMGANGATAQRHLADVATNVQGLAQMTNALQQGIEAQQRLFNPPAPAQPSAGAPQEKK